MAAGESTLLWLAMPLRKLIGESEISERESKKPGFLNNVRS